jgi:hypothetical protein
VTSDGSGDGRPDELWLAAGWPLVRAGLPAAPARVVEIGCGPLGGFVPVLRSAGYDAAGVDPEALEGPWYNRAEFERYEPPRPAHALVACTSLHHVADLGEVPDLAGVSDGDEQAAIDAGEIQANRIAYVGRRP